jgi:putative membrane protein
MRAPREYFFIFLKGMGMGGADIIPGVSGGTIAFITGIYEELLSSIKALDLDAIKLLFSGQLMTFWKKINGRFLVVLLGGILVSLISLARLISGLLISHPIQLWSFFFGLILISALVVGRDIKKWSLGVIFSLILGVIIAFLITKAVPAETPDNILTIFLSGAIAICAMILPGISGSFILLILGKYTFILTALKEFDLGVISIFSGGCLLGLITFSRLISWLFKKYRDVTIALLAGFMIGSLNKVWPWKVTVETFIDRHGVAKPLIQENILPNAYLSMGNDPFFWYALLFFTLGVGLVVFLEKLAVNLKNG